MLTISGNDVKWHKNRNECKHFLVNVIYSSDMIFNREVNPFYSLFQNSNHGVLKQNKYSLFNQFYYSSTEMNDLHPEN